MATQTPIQNSADVEKQNAAGKSENSGGASSEDQFSAQGDAIMVDGRFRQVYEISVGQGPRKKMGWRIHEGSEVTIYGSYLDIYHQIILVVNGSPYYHKNLHPKQALDDRTTISFYVTNDIKGLYSDASLVYLKFVGDNASNDRFLKENFRYYSETEEEKEKRGKPAGKEAGEEWERQQATKGPGAFTAFVEGGLSPLGAIAEGLKSTTGASSSGAKTVGQGTVAPSNAKEVSSGGTVDDIDYDSDVTSEDGGTSGQPISSTAKVSTGGRTISQGGTVTAATGGQIASSGTAEATRTIGASGTIEQKQTSEIPSSGTVRATGGTTVSGQTTGTAQVQGNIPSGGARVSGTVEGGGGVVSASGTVSGGSRGVSGQATVTGENRIEAEAKVQSQSQQPVSPQPSAGGEVTGQKSGEQSVSASAAASGTSEAQGTISQGGTAEAGLNLKVEGTQKISDEFVKPAGPQAQEEKLVKPGAGQTLEARVAPPAVQTEQPPAPAQASTPAQTLPGKGSVDSATGQKQSTKPLQPSRLPPTPTFSGGTFAPPLKPPGPTSQPLPGSVFGGGATSVDGVRLGISGTLNLFKKREVELKGKLGQSIKRPEGQARGEQEENKDDDESKPEFSPVSGSPESEATIAPPLSSPSGGLGEGQGENLPQDEQGSENEQKKPVQRPDDLGQPQDQNQSQGPGAGDRKPGEPEPGPNAGPEAADAAPAAEEEAAGAGSPELPAAAAALGPEAAVAAAAINTLAKSKAGQEIVGKATSQVWWYGFSCAAAFFFTGLDFFIGAAIMDVYWVSMHRRQPELFPMKPWQKVVTVAANVLPLVLLFFFISVLMVVGCNYPLPIKTSAGNSYKLTVIGAFIGDDCKFFDINNINSNPIDSRLNTAPTLQTNSPVSPRGPATNPTPATPPPPN